MIFRTLRSKCALLVTVCVLVLGAATYAAADSITLAWDESSSLVGYKVHVGVQSGSYTQHFDVGSAEQFTFSTATAGQRYCFAVSAYLLSSRVEGPNSSEVCGYSNAPPTLTNPGNRTSTVGQPVTLQLVGSDPDHEPVTYSATGLPPGISVQASTGFVSGTGTTAGTYSVTARVYDGVLTTSQTFSWAMTTGGGDTTRPTVSIASPTTSTTTSSSMLFSGSASDNVAVTQVTWSSDRGGSGVATGTTNWSAAGIPLATGTNVITITARDAAGNSATASRTLTRSGTTSDTTRPSVSIGTPTTGTSYSTTRSPLTIGGSASDNVGVTQVRWSTNSGRSGVASGTTNWSASIPLVNGSNVVTITAVDGAGNQGVDSLTVTYTGSNAPTVSISTPTTGSSYSATRSPLTIGGSASDNIGVTQVRWSTNRGTSGVATGTTNWTASIPLSSGSTTITITALDSAGNQASDSLTVTYSTSSSSSISLSVREDSWRTARLNWTGATSSSVDVYRNGTKVKNTNNDGSTWDEVPSRGTYSYKICAGGSTSVCSNTVSIYLQ